MNRLVCHFCFQFNKSNSTIWYHSMFNLLSIHSFHKIHSIPLMEYLLYTYYYLRKTCCSIWKVVFKHLTSKIMKNVKAEKGLLLILPHTSLSLPFQLFQVTIGNSLKFHAHFKQNLFILNALLDNLISRGMLVWK